VRTLKSTSIDSTDFDMSTRASEAQAVRVAKAIGDPMRFRILREIARRAEVSCRELVERIPISQPTISHHVKVLAEAGLVSVRKDRGFHFYSLRRQALDAHLRQLGGLAAGARAGKEQRP
jgi:DNA-binding transcriptional ArsR family regulator